MSNNAHMEMLWAEMPLFLTLARLGTLQRAADQLGVNRTTVARRLAALEQKIGSRLFASEAGKYLLTTVGRELITVAEAAEAALYKSESLLFDQHVDPVGPLKITVPPHLMQMAAPAFLALAKKFPELEIDLIATYQLEAIEARHVDLALRILRNTPKFPLFGYNLKTLRGAMFRPKGGAGQDLVHVVRHGEVETPAYIWRKPPEVRELATDDIWAKQEMIAAGGIGRLPLFMGDGDARLERASEILPDAGWRLWLVTQDAFRASPRLRAVIEELTQFFSALPDA